MARFPHNRLDVIEPRAVLPQRFAPPARGRVSMQLSVRKPFWLSFLAGMCLVSTTWADEPPKAKPVEEARPEAFTADQKEHWAYQPIRRPELPEVRKARWVRNPIDRFILAELETAEMAPAPEADRVALIRRVTFDLTGLPPRADDVAAFLNERG